MPSLTLNNWRDGACGVLPSMEEEVKAAGDGADAGRGEEELVELVPLLLLTRLLSPGR
jgi:hypothetical protein